MPGSNCQYSQALSSISRSPWLDMKVTVTPSVLRWAIDSSGYPLEEVAAAAGVPLARFRDFLVERDRPTLSEARSIARKLRRPLAALLLPEPPQGPELAVEFRHPSKGRRKLNPDELLALRTVARVQGVTSWLAKDTGKASVDLPKFDLRRDPEQCARIFRENIAAPTLAQLSGLSPSGAFQSWRAAIEDCGILVFVLSLGEESCRGFSIWDDWTPVAVVNSSAWAPPARVYTLLHEVAHLLTRTSSACASPVGVFARSGGDNVERWCETFAAATILPLEVLKGALGEALDFKPGQKVTTLSEIAKVARRTHASLRATALSLIKTGLADTSLYGKIPAQAERPAAAGGGPGRSRLETRTSQFGDRAARLLIEGVESGALVRSDVMDYLNVSQGDVEALAEQFAR